MLECGREPCLYRSILIELAERLLSALGQVCYLLVQMERLRLVLHSKMRFSIAICLRMTIHC